MDFDLEPLKGKKIEKARLYVKKTGDERLYRVGVSSITADWIEGSGVNYEKQEGSSSFRWRINPSTPWFDNNIGLSEKRVTENTDMTSVMFGLGGSIWANAEATDPEDDWQMIEVNVDVVTARIYGLSYGFVVFDDTGTELERDEDNVKIRLFPNRFVYSKDQNRASAPYLEVEFNDYADAPIPGSVENLQAVSKQLPSGDVILTWEHSQLLSDEIVGFLATIDGEPLPQALVPQPALAETAEPQVESRFFKTRLSGLDTKKEHKLEVTAVSRFGKISEPALLTFKASSKAFEDWKQLTELKGKKQKIASSTGKNANNNLKWNDSSLSIVDEFIKFTENGSTVPQVPDSYFSSNVIWNSTAREINLNSAKNEFIGFQIVFSGKNSVSPTFSVNWKSNSSSNIVPQVNFYRFTRVKTPEGAMPDPAILLKEGEKVELEQKVDTVYCELYIPHEMKNGNIVGKLSISDGSKKALELNINLNVWDFTLPNTLSFLPEMNCYSLPEKERDYYRLAQLHRTYINRVPYSHRGTVGDGLTPNWNAETKSFDWKDWEARFAQYFDGSAFADLPRGAVPIEAFYLPLFENYPANIFKGFKGENTWPDPSAFSQEYREDFAAGVKQFAQEISEKNWNQTLFMFFLNNKMDYKKNGWSKASSPWLLDEPASYRDFAALQFFGRQVKKVLAENQLENTMKFRADVSRPQWERNSLDDSLGVYVVGDGSIKDYRQMVIDRCSNGRRLLYAYGTTAAPHESAYQPIMWTLDAWSIGADGIVPWQTIGNDDSWKNGDELSLFYPAVKESNGQIVPSIRLKAYRRGQQDAEYLTYFLKVTGRSREEVAGALRERLNLDKKSHRSLSEEDAGTSLYEGATVDELQMFRIELGQFLNEVTNNRK